ncbi:hypothetical protein OL330_004633 [Vibrio parahaemolyticus]|nr:hypothetical protein [Vibrio parahaemolyticus]ELA9378167.1 hypothetical protein [Vibrio parahaemolyticus]ELK8487524.1 hypothetical protein [Vibrio parahaemolyticus]
MSKSNAKIVTPPQVQLSEQEMSDLVDCVSSINISDLLRDEMLKPSHEKRFSGFNAIKVFQNVFRTTAIS